MTLMMETSPMTALAEVSILPADFAAPPRWANAATRAHALLTQTMSDEEVDDLVAGAGPFDQPFVLPPFFFG